MNRLRLLATACVLALSITASFGQVTGIQTVPGSFATLEAAVTALNATGVGAGGATINVAAGYTETPSASLILTIATNSPTATNPLVIQKSGTGANPLITAPTTGTSTTVDGIFVLNGVDYVTINGIDLQENAANVTTTTQMEWGYALVKSSNLNGCQNVTIKNSTVTLNKSNTATSGIYVGNNLSTNTTALVISSFGATNSFNKFYNNTVTNCAIGYNIIGYASAAPYDFYDQSNVIGVDGTSTRRSQVTNFGGSTLTASGISATNQNGLSIFKTYINNNGGAPHTGALNGINTITGTNSNLNIYNDTITISNASTTGSTVMGINNTMGGTGAGNTVNIYNNVIDGCTYTANTTGTFRGISSTATATYTNMYNNKVTNNSIPGTGEFSAIYYGGSSVTLCLLVNLNDNIISGNTKTGTTGLMYLCYASASTATTNCYNNQMFNNNCATSSGALYGYYNFAFANNENVYNNTIRDNTGGTGETVMLFVRSGSGPTNKEVYGNSIYNITAAPTAASVGAIIVGYGTLVNVYKNNIYNISNTGATGITPSTYGINIDANVNIQVNVYNNFISELKAPNVSNIAGVYGLWLQGSTTSVLNAYYNTVYLNATSVGANFGTAAVVAGVLATQPFSTDLRNNIFVNVSTAAGTGFTRAILRPAAALTNYATTSGYNCLFAGTPSAVNHIYSDGTNNDQTLLAFKNRVGPREQASFSSLPPFVNVSSSPYNLHLQASVATQCESGAKAIPGFTTDYDAATRGATPDVGADEIAGITVDIASPDIQYVLLGNSSPQPTRVLTSFATITDPSGINTAVGTRPRLYYKKSTQLNTYNTNTNATDGWKYVEASNTSSPFSFTIDYSLLFGGGVVNGDIIQYFVVAQDLNGTPNFGWNNGGFTVQPTTVNLAAANFPLTNTINQYTIVAAALSGSVNVGPAELITSLTNAGGLFQLINAGALSGNLTANITGDLTAETGTFALNQWAEEGVGNYTLTIAPSAAVVRNIYGSSAAAALIRFDGADRVNIDGRFASAGSYLMFRNTSNAAPTVGYLNDAQNNTLQYCIIESGNTATSATLGGAVWIGTTTGANGNDNISINNNEIRDRSDVAGTPTIGINCVGTNGILTQFNNNVTISNNNIHDWYLLNSASQFGINVGVGNSGFTISGNSFYQTATRTNTVAGAVVRCILISNTAAVNSNGGFVITNNFIGGTAPGATGGDMTYNVSAAGVSQTFGGISVTTGLIPNQIQGNTIRKIDFSLNVGTAAATVWFGINLGQGIHNVGNTTGNTIGDVAANNSIKITMNSGGAVSAFIAGVLASTISGSYNIQNNTIAGITMSGTTTSAIVPQWIQVQGTPVQNSTVTGNTIGGPLANSIVNNSITAPVVSFSIRHLVTSGVGANISNNTIQNITDNSPAATSVNYGILLISTVGGQGTLTVNNNTVKDMTLNSIPTGSVFGNLGISFQNNAGITHTVNNNLISGLFASNTGVAGNYVVGIQTQGNSMGGTMKQNRVWDLRNANNGAAGTVAVYISSGLSWDIINNMFSVTNTGFTNNMDANGIVEFMGVNTTLNVTYNSIIVAGSQPAGSTSTYAFARVGAANTTVRDNIFYNRRSGGAGNHIALGNLSAVPAFGWNSNYNALVTIDTTKLAQWGVAVNNMSAWRTNSAGDANSIWQTATTITAASLFVNATTGDLHINTSTFPEALATPIPGITVDYDNNPRSATFPTIGADELPCSAIAFTVTAQTNVLCNGGNNGSATVSGTGGNGLTYSWAPSGGNAATATGLTAGTYTCTITNICGNGGTVTVTITQPSVITASLASTNVNCNGNNNGTATVTASGGTGTLTYSWNTSPVQTTATATGLAPGSYTCTITDANGCTTTQSVTITQPTVLTSSLTSSTNIACYAGNTGAASVSASGGTNPLTYSWNSTPVQTTATATGLPAGTYTCTITDANGCTSTQSVTLTEAPEIIIATVSTINVTCNGGNNGAITVNATGGTGALTYSWNTSPVQTTPTITGLVAGTYICTVTDASGCTSASVFTILEPSAIVTSVSSQTNVGCNGGNNGSATVTASGGTGTLTYSWNTSPVQTTATATGLSAGTYSCTITDGNNCTMVQVVTITEPAVLAATAVGTNPTTCGGSDGSIDVTVTGGTATYTYAWGNGPTAEDQTGLPAGTYSVVITDANGCTTTTNATLNDPNAPAVTLSIVDDTLCLADASIILTGESPVGGTWSGPGVSGNTFDPNTAGVGTHGITYTYTDINGCTGFAIDSILVDICNTIATATVINEVKLYPNPNNGQFFINTPSNGTVELFDNLGQLVLRKQLIAGTTEIGSASLANGMYTVRFTDVNNQVQQIKLMIQH